MLQSVQSRFWYQTFAAKKTTYLPQYRRALGWGLAGCIWEMMLCPRWRRDLTGELNPKLQKSLHVKKKNPLFAITANNHTGRSSTTISKSASSNAPADAQKTAFAHNSKGEIKAQIHWRYPSACRLQGSWKVMLHSHCELQMLSKDRHRGRRCS